VAAAVAERHEALVAAFAAFRHDPAFTASHQSRESAFHRFLESGFPTTRDEEWRHTNVAPIAAVPFVRARAASPTGHDVDPFRFAGVPAIVLVNGLVSMELSALDALPPGMTVRTTTENPGNTSMAAFADLNAAFFEQIVVVSIASHAIVEMPLHVLSLVVATGEPSIVAPRVVIHVGEGAQCHVIEDYAGLGSGTTLTTAITNVILDSGAVVDHVKLQRESSSAFHVASLQAQLGRASTFASRALTFGGRIVRNDITALLAGEGAECTLNGLYVATGRRLVDTHTTIDHAQPHCPSHEVYKGILAGHAHAVFNGKIIVRPQAQKTNAKQTNKALLLSDEAQVNTKPQLEIFADDVKCTHGAAIGQLDEDALFYLRARGVAEADARHMLIEAFAGEIIDGITVPGVRDRAHALLEETLSGEAYA
jgi:Fe-S cluster assembly protein SufD